MESGTIARWNVKEGQRFEPGTAVCEVETDKATVTYEAQDEGFIAKILVGNGEVKVGQPMMITVDDISLVDAFKSFTMEGYSPSTPTPAPAPTPIPSPPTPAPVAASIQTPTPTHSSGRVVASPFARMLAREGGVDLTALSGSGPNGRIVAHDVLTAPKTPVQTQIQTQSPVSAPAPAPVVSAPVSVSTGGVPGVFQDFELSPTSRALAARYTYSKQAVPHYYLSVEVNMNKLLKLRSELNASISGDKKEKEGGLSVIDFVVKASALSMKQVPDVNASWMDTFVRRYDQVDVNVITSGEEGSFAPVVRDAGGKGLKAISQEVAACEEAIFASQSLEARNNGMGTFSIHNLGLFGVKSAAPIVLPPQACALGMGAIVDTVVPNPSAKEGEDNWSVAPVMTVTLSCDHRVIDGAVGAQWLASFKTLLENPTSMLL